MCGEASGFNFIPHLSKQQQNNMYNELIWDFSLVQVHLAWNFVVYCKQGPAGKETVAKKETNDVNEERDTDLLDVDSVQGCNEGNDSLFTSMVWVCHMPVLRTCHKLGMCDVTCV